MLKSIIKESYINRINTDRVTNKKSAMYFNVIFSVIFITLLLFTILLIKIDHQKQLNKFNNFLINSGFTIKNIEILGIKHISKKSVVEIINAENKSNIFNVNLSNIYNKINANDWVKDLYVERVLPNTIKISIKEKKPIGIWQYGMYNKLITKDGDVISTANANKFTNNLPIIHGNHANKSAYSILKILKKNQNFSKNIWSLTYINNRRWNLHFKQGIIILLPSKDVLEAWNKIIKLQEEYDVLNLGLTELDFRNPDKILGRINFDKSLIKHRKSL